MSQAIAALDSIAKALANIPISAYRQDNTSNSSIDINGGLKIQFGYGVFATGAAASKSEAVTFPIAYTSTPIVICTAGGDDTAGATTLGAGNSEDQSFHCFGASVTTTGFTAYARALANWAAGTTVFYHWVSIGI